MEHRPENNVDFGPKGLEATTATWLSEPIPIFLFSFSFYFLLLQLYHYRAAVPTSSNPEGSVLYYFDQFVGSCDMRPIRHFVRLLNMGNRGAVSKLPSLLLRPRANMTKYYLFEKFVM